jgi:hypothetical protein
MSLTAEDIKVGHWYEAKRPRITMGGRPNNDRQVVWIGQPGTYGVTNVQYDSDTVKTGRQLPNVTMDEFLKWAKREICEEEHESRYAFNKKQKK